MAETVPAAPPCDRLAAPAQRMEIDGDLALQLGPELLRIRTCPLQRRGRGEQLLREIADPRAGPFHDLGEGEELVGVRPVSGTGAGYGER